MSTVLTLEEMISIDDTEFKELTVVGFPQPFRLGSLTAESIIDFMEAREGAKGKEKRLLGLQLISKSVVDDAGNRIGNESLVAALAKKNQKNVGALIDAVMDLNGLNAKND